MLPLVHLCQRLVYGEPDLNVDVCVCARVRMWWECTAVWDGSCKESEADRVELREK